MKLNKIILIILILTGCSYFEDDEINYYCDFPTCLMDGHNYQKSWCEPILSLGKCNCQGINYKLDENQSQYIEFTTKFVTDYDIRPSCKDAINRKTGDK